MVASHGRDPDVRAEILRRYEFERGFARRWISGTGTIVDLRLYQFSSPEMAREFNAEDLVVNQLSWGEGKAVDSVPGGKTFVKSTLDADGYAQTLSLAVVGGVTRTPCSDAV